MSKIPSAEEFFKQYCNLYQFEEGSPEYLIDSEDFQTTMIEYAKMHVEAALKEALLKGLIHTKGIHEEGINFLSSSQPNLYYSEDLFSDYYQVEVSLYKESILNAYPISNIK